MRNNFAILFIVFTGVFMFSFHIIHLENASNNREYNISKDANMIIDNEYEVNLPLNNSEEDEYLIRDGSQRFYFDHFEQSETYDCSTEEDGCVPTTLSQTYLECEEVYHAIEEDMENYCATSNKPNSVTLKTDERLNHVTAPITETDYEVITHEDFIGEEYKFIEPWDIEPITDDRYLVTGLDGHIYDIKNNDVTIYEVDVLQTGPGDQQEDNYVGLMGAVKHPNFSENQQIYLHYSYNTSDIMYHEGTLNKVSMFEIDRESETITKKDSIIDEIPGRQYYHGGRMRFGPQEQYLYITTGAAVYDEAQNPDFLGGKILRLNPDGTIPDNNPYNNSVYARGLRNPQGLDFDPETGDLIIAQHGEHRRDNIAKINKNTNLGWPNDCKRSNPMAEYGQEILCTQTYTLAPSGMSFIDDENHPWYNDLFVASLRGSQVHRIQFEDRKAVKNEIFWFNGYRTKPYPNYGNRIRDVEYFNEKLYILHDNEFITKISAN